MWYFEQSGQTTGPVSEADIQAATVTGRITPATLVWRDGMPGWQPAAQTELARLFAAPPRPALATVPPLPPGGVPAAAAPTPLAILPPPAPFTSPPSALAPMPGIRFAGFWIRFAAYIVDAILVQIGAYALAAIIAAAMAQAVLMSDQPMEFNNVQITTGLLVVAWTFAYYLVTQAGPWQATPGKHLLGLRVIREDGRHIGVALSLGRYLGYIVSGLILGIGFLMAGWTEQKRALHDMMCGTRVIYARN